MQEIIEAVEKRMQGDSLATNFTLLSEKWAVWCLRNHRGKLLVAGLLLAKALADYQYKLDE